MLSIRYLYNSGFMLELDRYILIFDYYPGPGQPILGGAGRGTFKPVPVSGR